MKKSRGFTLIEIMIAVVILVILTVIVIVSMESSKNKAADSEVRINLERIRPHAEILYDRNGCYGNNPTDCAGNFMGPCENAPGIFTDSEIISMINNAKSSGIEGPDTSSCLLSADRLKWGAVIKYKSGNKAWCVDSSGKSEEVTFGSNSNPNNNPNQATLNSKFEQDPTIPFTCVSD